MSLRQRLVSPSVAAFVVLIVIVGLAPVPGPLATPTTKAGVAKLYAPPHVVKNSKLAISPVFSQTLVGGFDQAGNTLLDCATLTNGNPLPAGGCVRDISTALAANPPGPTYNNQVVTKFLDRDKNSGTTRSSSATVSVPTGATVVYAELWWLGTTELSGNPGITDPPQSGGWDPSIYTQPMKMSIGDDQHYVTVQPDQGTSIQPTQPGTDTNDYYYSASANVTSLLAGRTGQITVWGADAPFPANGFNMAGLGWNIVVVYQYPSVDLSATPPLVAKQITVQTGFVYQQSVSPPTNTVVNVPAITDPTQVQTGLIAGEGDTGLTGDTFSVNGTNIKHPVTGQTNNFFVSYAQNATNPNWTSNFSTDNVAWTLAPGIVHAGDTSVTLTTTTSGDGYFLAGLTTAIPVPAVCLAKSVDTNPYTTVGQTLTYTFKVTNCSGAPIDRVTVSDPLFVASPGTISACGHPAVLAPGASYTCTATHAVTQADIAAGQIVNTATANAFIPDTTTAVAPATASATTKTSTQLSITKTGSPKPVHVGDPFTYTITVTNRGTADAANVKVTDPLPAGLVNPTASVTQGASGSTATISGGTLTATTPLLTHSAPNTFVITVHGTIASNFADPSITNTAKVEAPNTNCVDGTGDPACSATDTTPVLQRAPITITKVTDTTTPSPGQMFTFTVQVRNTSATTNAAATVNDPVPAGLVNASWTCTASTGSTCGTPSGTGNIVNVALTLQPLGVATFTITVTVDPTFQGVSITNTATATPGTDTVCEANPAATSCPADVQVSPSIPPAALQITKAHNATPELVPGGPITYTVTVTNTSTATIAHGNFNDPVPAQVVADGGWTTATTGTGTTATPSSAATGFPTGVALVIAPLGTVTFTIRGHVANPYNGTEVTNVAISTPGLNTDCEDGQPTCRAEVGFTNPAQLEVAKSHSFTNSAPVAGQPVTYTVTVTNPATGATASGTFSDPLPDPPLDAAGATWTCTPSTGSTCGSATGTGSPAGVAITVAPNGGTVTFAITVTIRPSGTAVTVDNVASVTPGPGTACADGQPTCDGEDTFTATPETALLTIEKTQAPTTPAQGGVITYRVVVTNTSEFTTAHATLDDPVPAQVVADGGWTTATTVTGTTATPSSAATGFPTGVALVVAPLGTVTFTISAHLSATYDGTEVTNTATATPGTNTACADGESSCEANVSFANPAQLTVQKSHTPDNPAPVPGQRFTYSVTVTNPTSGATASGAFSDPLPDPPLDAAGATWTCTPSTGSTCGSATGTGSPAGVAITVAPNGGTVTFAITVTIRPSGTAVTVDNVASVTPGPGTACADGQPTCNGEDVFPAEPTPATLTIAKTHEPSAPTQGQAFTYTIKVTNTSTLTVAHGTVNDPLDSPALTAVSWTATVSSGGSVSPASASGAITGVQLVLPPGGVAAFTVHATVRSDWPGGNVINTAVVNPGADTTCDPKADQSCSASNDFPTPSLITIVKTHEPTTPLPSPGRKTTYRVTVTNLSGQQPAHATFADPLPPQLDRAGAVWTTQTTGTGTTAAPASGSGSPVGVALTLGPQGTVTFVITAPILPGFQGGTITNTGTATPGENTACDREVCHASTSFEPPIPPALLAIMKSVSPSEHLTPGDSITYTITVTNSSAATTGHGTITDAVSAGLAPGGSWTATATPGSTVTPTSGSQSITADVTVAPGGRVTFTRAEHVDPAFASDFNVNNVATLTPGTNTQCGPTHSTQACTTNAVVHINVFRPPSAPVAPTSPIVPKPTVPVTG
jgi:uncharacterized repeat protein (TIGR01451 family)